MISLVLVCAISQFNELPTKAKAVITDQFGQPLPLEREAVGLLVASARKSDADSVKWTVLPAEYDSRKWVPNDDGLEFGIALEGKPVDITIFLSVAKGGSVDHIVMTVKCGRGPPGPGPGPGPSPKADKLKLIVVEDSLNRKPATSLVLQDRAMWDTLKPHSYLIVPENTQASSERSLVERILKANNAQKLPVGGAYLLVLNAATDEQLFCDVLPSSDEIKSLVSRLTK